jgi:putative component of toxin-antitoxin plasmid stabilization module
MPVPNVLRLDGILAELGTPNWGPDPDTTRGLTYGYIGGTSQRNPSQPWAQSANGTVELTPNTVNYVERDTEGVVTANVVGFSPESVPLARITTDQSRITAFQDWRPIGMPPSIMQQAYPLLAGEVGVVHLQYPVGDIRRYGATPGLDNTEPLTNAFASRAATGGGPVIVPQTNDPLFKYYEFEDTVPTGEVPVELRGDNLFRYAEASWLLYTGVGDAFDVQCESFKSQGVRVTTTTGQRCFVANHCYASQFDTVEVVGFLDCAYEVTNSWWLRWKNCHVQGANNDTSRGIVSEQNFNQNVLDGVKFTCVGGRTWVCCDINTAGHGVGSSTGSVFRDVDISHGIFAAGQYALRFHSGCYGMHVSACRLEAEGLGFLWHQDNAFGLTVEGCQLAGGDVAPMVEGIRLGGGWGKIDVLTWHNTTTCIYFEASARATYTIESQATLAGVVNLYGGATAGIGPDDRTGGLAHASRRRGAAKYQTYRDTLVDLGVAQAAALRVQALAAGHLVGRLVTVGGHQGVFELSIGYRVGTGFVFVGASGANCVVTDTGIAAGIHTFTLTGLGDGLTYTLHLVQATGTMNISASAPTVGTTYLTCELTSFTNAYAA